MNDLDNTKFVANDNDGTEIYLAAWKAIANARFDGQSSGKHSPESWKEESIENQLSHTFDHVASMYNPYMQPLAVFDIKESEHALCRLAIAIALYKRENQNG